jgi:hypothetical protein
VSGIPNNGDTLEVPVLKFNVLSFRISRRLVFHKSLTLKVFDPDLVVVWVSAHLKTKLHESLKGVSVALACGYADRPNNTVILETFADASVICFHEFHLVPPVCGAFLPLLLSVLLDSARHLGLYAVEAKSDQVFR